VYDVKVQYNTNGWLDKNKDPIQECVVELMANSKEPLVSCFFKDPEDGGSQHFNNRYSNDDCRNWCTDSMIRHV